MDKPPTADALSRFESRLPGSDSERRAALALRDRLAAGGHAASVEPFRFHQRWALAQAIAVGLSVVGSVLAVSNATAGTALVAVAALSSIAEGTGRVALLRRLTGTRASQNVSCPPGTASRPGLLVVAASYDAPRESAFGRLAERVRDPWSVLGAALLAVLACCAARLLGAEGNALTAVQLIPTLLLLAAVPLLVDAELSSIGDGDAEAAGVEVALELAERLDGELAQLDVWLVLTGAGAALGAGTRVWRRRHRDALNARPTVTIEVGVPEPDEVDELLDGYADLARRLDASLRPE
jgi:hypothetical protein